MEIVINSYTMLLQFVKNNAIKCEKGKVHYMAKIIKFDPTLKSAGLADFQKAALKYEDGREVECKHDYDIIYADPPWSRNQGGARGASRHYDLMALEDIKAMPVADFCAENAALYLWVINSGLQDGLDVMKAWGFDYKTMFVWKKERSTIGVYNRNKHESILFGVRGKMLPEFHSQPSCCEFPLQDHSHKPEEYHTIIQRMYPNRSYLELFARRHPFNKDWDIWGLEAPGGSDVYIPGYPVPLYSDKVKFVDSVPEAKEAA